MQDADAYRQWLEATQAPALAQRCREAGQACADFQPLLSVILPVHNTPLELLRCTVDSVREQIYPNWQLCIADDGSDDAGLQRLLKDLAQGDSRINAVRLESTVGIAGASNAALALARGRYCALLDHDDLLAPEALLLLVNAIRCQPDAALLYSDSDRLDPQGRRCEPYCKTGFNYDLFLTHNYFNHLSCYATALLREIGGFRPGYEGSQDYDLALRALEQVTPERVVHLPEILYHWRRRDASVTGSRLAEAVAAGRRAVQHHLQRQGHAAEVRANPLRVIYNRVIWPLPKLSVAVLSYGPPRTVTGPGPGYEVATLDSRSAGDGGGASLAETFTRRLRQWADRQEADLLCFLHSDTEWPELAELTDLTRPFSRQHVLAVGSGPGASGVPDAGPAFSSAADLLCCMDQAVNELASPCIMVRREQFPELLDVNRAGLCLRDTMSAPGALLWTPHGPGAVQLNNV